MATFSVNNIELCGMAACVHKKAVSNMELELLSVKEREALVRNVGIEWRRVAGKEVCTSDLCETSARTLLDALRWEGQVDVLIFVTQTPDYITPATAGILQKKLGLPNGCIALDINLGCSGFVYGLAVAASLLQTLGRGRALVLAGDVSTACISERDKSTVPIFSDAGSATALQWRAGAPALFFNLQGDGSGFEAIMIPAGGYRNPPTEGALRYEQEGEGIVRNQLHLRLNGIDIFNFSINEVPKNVEALLAFSGRAREEVDYFVFHQANRIINEAIRKKLKLTERQTPSSLRHFGNTSSATIPVTVVTQIRNEVQAGALRLALCGFGVGLSWSSALVETRHLVCPALVEHEEIQKPQR